MIGAVTEIGRSEQARSAREGKQTPCRNDKLVLEIVNPREPRTANGSYSSISPVGNLLLLKSRCCLSRNSRGRF